MALHSDTRGPIGRLIESDGLRPAPVAVEHPNEDRAHLHPRARQASASRPALRSGAAPSRSSERPGR